MKNLSTMNLFNVSKLNSKPENPKNIQNFPKSITNIYSALYNEIDIPTEQEILAMMEEIQQNPQNFKFVA